MISPTPHDPKPAFPATLAITAPAWPLAFLLLAGLILASLAGLAVHYLDFAAYFDHGEPNMAIRSFRVAQGQAAYMKPEAEDFLLTLYGPLPYLWNGLFLKLLGGSILVSKLGGILAALIALAAFAHHAWHRFGPRWLAPGLALLAGGMLMATPFSLWTRADPVTLMCVTLGLVASAEMNREDRPWWAAGLALGLFTGLAMNVKAHGFIFLAPLAFGFAAKRWPLSWPLAALAAGLACYAPFLLPPFPPALYLETLSKAVGVRGIDPVLLVLALKHLAFFLMPLGLLPFAWKALPLNERLYALAYGLCALAGLYPASVAGSAWYQLVPFLPLWADLSLRLGRAALPFGSRRLAGVFMVLILVPLALGWPSQRRLHRYMSDRAWMSLAAQEIADDMAKHPGETMEMGFGYDVAETYRSTFLKPMLAFAGNPTTLDGWSDMEVGFVGLPVSEARLGHIRDCKTRNWLIPANEPPFTMRSVFANQDFLAPYRPVFLEKYRLAEKGRYFDLWTCAGERTLNPEAPG